MNWLLVNWLKTYWPNTNWLKQTDRISYWQNDKLIEFQTCRITHFPKMILAHSGELTWLLRSTPRGAFSPFEAVRGKTYFFRQKIFDIIILVSKIFQHQLIKIQKNSNNHWMSFEKFLAKADCSGLFSTFNGFFSTVKISTVGDIMQWGKFSTLEKSAADDVME